MIITCCYFVSVLSPKLALSLSSESMLILSQKSSNLQGVFKYFGQKGMFGAGQLVGKVQGQIGHMDAILQSTNLMNGNVEALFRLKTAIQLVKRNVKPLFLLCRQYFNQKWQNNVSLFPLRSKKLDI